MVARRLGVTLLPEIAVARESAATPGLAVVPLSADAPARQLALVRRATAPRRRGLDQLAAWIGERMATRL